MAVEAAAIGVGGEAARLADHRLARAEHQPPVWGERRGEAVERKGPFLGAEIEQHVAAQHDVIFARSGMGVEQIVDLEPGRAAQGCGGAPAIVAFLEPAQHLPDAEAALDLELRIDPGFGPADYGGRDVGAEQLDRPPRPAIGLLGEHHGERVEFLAGRTAGRPDAQVAQALAALGQRRQRIGGEQLERIAVAEEIGLVIEQRLDHLGRKRRFAAHDQHRNQLIERLQPALAHQ